MFNHVAFLSGLQIANTGLSTPKYDVEIYSYDEVDSPRLKNIRELAGSGPSSPTACFPVD